MAVTAAFSSLSRSYVTLERLMFAATIAADLETKFGESIGTGESQVMFWGADIRRAAYDPETISMLITVLERAVAALPPRTKPKSERRGWHQAFSGRPPEESETPFCFMPRHWSAALGSLR